MSTGRKKRVSVKQEIVFSGQTEREYNFVDTYKPVKIENEKVSIDISNQQWERIRRSVFDEKKFNQQKNDQFVKGLRTLVGDEEIISDLEPSRQDNFKKVLLLMKSFFAQRIYTPGVTEIIEEIDQALGDDNKIKTSEFITKISQFLKDKKLTIEMRDIREIIYPESFETEKLIDEAALTGDTLATSAFIEKLENDIAAAKYLEVLAPDHSREIEDMITATKDRIAKFGSIIRMKAKGADIYNLNLNMITISFEKSNLRNLRNIQTQMTLMLNIKRVIQMNASEETVAAFTKRVKSLGLEKDLEEQLISVRKNMTEGLINAFEIFEKIRNTQNLKNQQETVKSYQEGLAKIQNAAQRREENYKLEIARLRNELDKSRLEYHSSRPKNEEIRLQTRLNNLFLNGPINWQEFEKNKEKFGSSVAFVERIRKLFETKEEDLEEKESELRRVLEENRKLQTDLLEKVNEAEKVNREKRDLENRLQSKVRESDSEERKSLGQQIEKLNDILKEQVVEKTILSSNNERLRKELDELSKQKSQSKLLDEKDSRINELESRILEFTKSLENTKELESKKRQLEEIFNGNQETIRKQQNLIEKYEATIKNLNEVNNQKEVLEKDIASKNEDFFNEMRKVLKTGGSLSEITTSLKEKIDSLQNKISSSEAEKKLYRLEKTEFESKITRLERDNSGLLSEINAYNSNLKKKQQEINQITIELDQKTNEYNYLNDKNISETVERDEKIEKLEKELEQLRNSSKAEIELRDITLRNELSLKFKREREDLEAELNNLKLYNKQNNLLLETQISEREALEKKLINLNYDIELLRSQEKEKEGIIAELKTQTEELSQKLNESRVQLGEKTLELNSKEEELSKAEKEFKENELEFLRDKKQLEEKEKKLEAQKEELSKVQNDLDDLENDLKTKEDNLKEKEDDLEERERELEEREKELEEKEGDLEEELKKERGELEKRTKELKKLGETQEEKQEQLNALTKENKDLKDNISDLEEKLNSKKLQLRTKSDEVTFYNEQISRLSQTKTNLEEEKKSLNEILENNKTEVEVLSNDYERKISEKNRIIAELQSGLAGENSKESELLEVRNRLNAYEKESRDLNSENQRLKQETENLRSNIKRIEEKVESLNRSNKNLTERSREYIKDTEDREKDIDSLKNERKKLEAEIQTLKDEKRKIEEKKEKEIENLQGEISELEENASKTKKEQENRKKKLEEEIKERDKEIGELKEEVLILDQKNNDEGVDYNDKIDKLKEELERLREMQNLVGEANQRLSEYQIKIRDQNSENLSLRNKILEIQSNFETLLEEKENILSSNQDYEISSSLLNGILDIYALGSESLGTIRESIQRKDYNNLKENAEKLQEETISKIKSQEFVNNLISLVNESSLRTLISEETKRGKYDTLLAVINERIENDKIEAKNQGIQEAKSKTSGEPPLEQFSAILDYIGNNGVTQEILNTIGEKIAKINRRYPTLVPNDIKVASSPGFKEVLNQAAEFRIEDLEKNGDAGLFIANFIKNYLRGNPSIVPEELKTFSVPNSSQVDELKAELGAVQSERDRFYRELDRVRGEKDREIRNLKVQLSNEKLSKPKVSNSGYLYPDQPKQSFDGFKLNDLATLIYNDEIIRKYPFTDSQKTEMTNALIELQKNPMEKDPNKFLRFIYPILKLSPFSFIEGQNPDQDDVDFMRKLIGSDKFFGSSNLLYPEASLDLKNALIGLHNEYETVLAQNKQLKEANSRLLRKKKQVNTAPSSEEEARLNPALFGFLSGVAEFVNGVAGGVKDGISYGAEAVSGIEFRKNLETVLNSLNKISTISQKEIESLTQETAQNLKRDILRNFEASKLSVNLSEEVRNLMKNAKSPQDALKILTEERRRLLAEVGETINDGLTDEVKETIKKLEDGFVRNEKTVQRSFELFNELLQSSQRFNDFFNKYTSDQLNAKVMGPFKEEAKNYLKAYENFTAVLGNENKNSFQIHLQELKNTRDFLSAVISGEKIVVGRASSISGNNKFTPFSEKQKNREKAQYQQQALNEKFLEEGKNLKKRKS